MEMMTYLLSELPHRLKRIAELFYRKAPGEPVIRLARSGLDDRRFLERADDRLAPVGERNLGYLGSLLNQAHRKEGIGRGQFNRRIAGFGQSLEIVAFESSQRGVCAAHHQSFVPMNVRLAYAGLHGNHSKDAQTESCVKVST